MPKEYSSELERSEKLLEQSTTDAKEVSEQYQELILFLSVPDERVRENAIVSLGKVSKDIVDKITPLDLIQILDLLEDDDGIVRAKTAVTLRQLIKEDLDVVSQITDQDGLPQIYRRLSNLIENETSIIRRPIIANASHTLGVLIEERHKAWGKSKEIKFPIEIFFDCLTSEAVVLRRNAAFALAQLAKEYSDQIVSTDGASLTLRPETYEDPEVVGWIGLCVGVISHNYSGNEYVYRLPEISVVEDLLDLDSRPAQLGGLLIANAHTTFDQLYPIACKVVKLLSKNDMEIAEEAADILSIEGVLDSENPTDRALVEELYSCIELICRTSDSDFRQVRQTGVLLLQEILVMATLRQNQIDESDLAVETLLDFMADEGSGISARSVSAFERIAHSYHLANGWSTSWTERRTLNGVNLDSFSPVPDRLFPVVLSETEYPFHSDTRLTAAKTILKFAPAFDRSAIYNRLREETATLENEDLQAGIEDIFNEIQWDDRNIVEEDR